MPYTLSIGLLWFAAAALIGFVTGFALRSVIARRQLGTLRAAVQRDRAELDELRALTGLDTVTAPDAAHAAPPDSMHDAAGDAAGDTADDAAGDAGHDAAGTDPSDARVGDDLTVIEGLGPGAEELCRGIGICTYAELAATEVSLLRTLLDDAGPRYRVHDPTTWPHQAHLLATGRIEEHRRFVAALRDVDPPASTP